MDPVGSWSAYAASYNRLANASSYQNPPNSDLHHHMGTGVQAVPSTTTQLLAAHATSSLASSAASPFNPTGFLSPPPVGYDAVFPPLFHQKAHYGIQHRPLKQPEGDAYSQMAPNNFFEQSSTPSLAWSQNNAQLPSPFGILPHESVVPNSGVSAKTYENYNAHFAAAQSLNQFNSQISDYKNSSFIDPKKRPLSPITKAPVSTPFYQQTFPPAESNLNYRQSDYSVRSFQNGNSQQACSIPPSIPQGKEHRIPQPVRPQFLQQRNEKIDFPPPKQSIQKVPNKVYESEKRVEHDSQSSPISFAMIDAQRNFLTTKYRNQPYQNISNQQNYRFPMTPESDYQRSKSTESFGSTSSNPDCTIGLPRRPSPLQAHASPNNAPSPVYPMYNSPLTTISSPSPVQHETCFNKPSDITPPLDVSISRSSAPYNSVITRNEVRFDYNRQTWDDRQRRYSGYENNNGQNRQQYYDPSPQVNLQDLSSCRGDPMSLVKTLQQQQPEKVSDDKSKKKQKTADKPADADYFPRVPPPAHHNANQPNQNGYFDSERWNLAPPPSKIFPTSPVSFGSQPPISSNLPNQHQSLMVPHPALSLPYFPSLPYVPQSQPVEEAVSAEMEIEQPKVIVPNIEEELRCLIETDCENEEVIPTKNLSLNPGKSFMSSFVKYLNGEKESSPPNLRPVRRMMKPKIFQQTEIHENEVVNGTPTPVPEFPSDPQDDPRYFPLPKSSDKRSFDSSDSDGDNSFPFHSNVEKKVETPPPTPPVEKEVPLVKEDVTKKLEGRKKNKKKKKKDGKKKTQDKEAPHDPPRSRRETSKRKAKEMSIPLLGELENNSSDVSNSDSDPVWVPSEKSPNEKKKKSRMPRKQSTKSICSESSDEDDVPLAERTIGKKKKKNKSKKKNILVPKKALPQIITAAKPANYSSSKSNQLPFNIGDFVVLKTDLVLRHPPLWRVKEKTMLQKFQHSMKNGYPLYKNLPCYTGWSPESKHVYEGVTVKVLSTTKHDMVVQLLSNDIQELTDEEKAIIESTIDSTMKFQDYFEVYVQTLFSQALDANFLTEIFQEKDEYFLSNVRTVDDQVKELEKRLSSLLDWNEKFTSAVEQYASYNSYPRSGTMCQCGASGSCQLILSGIPYDKDTLQKLNENESSVETVLCRNCLSIVEVLHKLCHFKCSLYTVCEERVKEKRESEPDKDTTVVLNDLLADDVWLNQIFRSIQKEWGHAELMIGKLSKELPEN